MIDDAVTHFDHVAPVRSRVSWGAILAGATVALALHLLLTLLGAAVGLSIGDRLAAENLGTAAASWAIMATAVSLFAGGFVASQCTAGENKFESIIYGVMVWGVVFGMLLWLMASGVRSGLSAMVGMAQADQASAAAGAPEAWEVAARRSGVPQERIDEWRQRAPADGAARRKPQDPPVRDEVADLAAGAATRVAWWAFAGTLLSMLAAVAGAFIGAEATTRLISITRRPVARPMNHPAGRA